VAEALRRGGTVDDLAARSGIDRFFVGEIARVVSCERALAQGRATLADAKRLGLSDAAVAALVGAGEAEIRAQRVASALVPIYKIVDTCAGEFPAATPYYYSSYEHTDELPDVKRPRVVVLGAGPIRIGQGIEFDYSTVHAVKALREAGYEAVIINNNPETVSTDFDVSDRLYFEPLTVEDVLPVLAREQPEGVLVQFGGQTALNLAGPLAAAGVRLLGTSVESVDISEDREKFSALLATLGVDRPEGGAVRSLEACEVLLRRIGLPVVVRPSYVLGGRGMEIADTAAQVSALVADALASDPDHPVLIDRYIEGLEVEVDAISDGTSVLIPGIMEQVERAGVHSGDSIALLPAQRLPEDAAASVVAITTRVARALQVRGFINLQFVYDGTRCFVLEANLRASRTVPFVSKAVGVPLVPVATRVMLGDALADLGWGGVQRLPDPPRVAAKVPVFSMEKLINAEPALGPEMRSTGEVMGFGADAAGALHTALLAAGWVMPERTLLVSLADRHKAEAIPLLREFAAAGFRLLATPKTATALRSADLETELVSPEQAHEVRVGWILNTPTRGGDPSRNGFKLRRRALERRIPCITSLDTAAALLHAVVLRGWGPAHVHPLPEAVWG
jgi:carbamoyl-phosphate synthase large subunit